MADRKRRKTSKSQAKKDEPLEQEQRANIGNNNPQESIHTAEDTFDREIHPIQGYNQEESLKFTIVPAQKSKSDDHGEKSAQQGEKICKRAVDDRKTNSVLKSVNKISQSENAAAVIPSTLWKDTQLKKAILLFHFSHEINNVPSYVKAAVVFEMFYEKLEQVFLEYVKSNQAIEAQFIMDMNIYFNFLSLNIANELVQFKKIVCKKVEANTQAKRAADMAKTFHKFLKKNQGHWN